MLLSRDEALREAEDAIDYRAKSYVETCRNLALYVVNQDEKLRALAALVENIEKSDPEVRDAVIRAAVAAAHEMIK